MTRTKKQRKSKIRPPRVFTTKKGQKYIKVKGKKYKLKVNEDISIKGLIKLFLKYLVPHQKKQQKRKRGKKGSKVIISDFDRLEYENRNQVNRQLDKLKQEKYEKIHEIEKKDNEIKEKKEKQRLNLLEDKVREQKQPLMIGAPSTPDQKTNSRPTYLTPTPKKLIMDQVMQQLEMERKTAENAIDEADKKQEELKLKNQALQEAENKSNLQMVRQQFREGPAKKLRVSDLEELIPKDERKKAKQKPTLVNILLDKMTKEQIEKLNGVSPKKQKSAVRKMFGKGNAGELGLSTDGINDMMKEHDWFLGTIPADKIDTLKPMKRKKFGFIMNLDKSDKSGSHWVAIYIDLDKDRSIEYYDPLVSNPTKQFQEQMKAMIDKLKPDVYLKFKVNKIKHQSNKTDTCGWHSMRFLLERSKGNRFKFCSGMTDLKEGEVLKLKAQKGFGFYI